MWWEIKLSGEEEGILVGYEQVMLDFILLVMGIYLKVLSRRGNRQKID